MGPEHGARQMLGHGKRWTKKMMPRGRHLQLTPHVYNISYVIYIYIYSHMYLFVESMHVYI